MTRADCGPYSATIADHRINLANPIAFDTLCFGHDPRRDEPPALMQLMGHADIQTTLIYVQRHSTRRLLEYARAVAQHIRPLPLTTAHERARRPPLKHPLAPVFDRAVDSLGAGLSPETTRHHRGTARIPQHLGADHPECSVWTNCA